MLNHTENPSATPASPIPLYLWWNILSLDAPAVATAWCLLFAHARKIAIPLPTIATLALVVWIIYIADRLLDSRPGANEINLRARHIFYGKHRRTFVALIIAASAIGGLLAFADLSANAIRAGLALSVLVLVYIAWVHIADEKLSCFLPKEFAVGLLFAAGSSLPIWAQPGGFSWPGAARWTLFAATGILNCLAIESWEHNTSASTSQNNSASSELIAWANPRIANLAIVLAAAAFAICAILKMLAIGAAIAAAALLMALLDRQRNQLGSSALRVLADAALVLPALAALVLQRL
jgi:hypothetical protein